MAKKNMTLADEFFSLPPRYRTKKKLNEMIKNSINSLKSNTLTIVNTNAPKGVLSGRGKCIVCDGFLEIYKDDDTHSIQYCRCDLNTKI